MQHHFEIVLLTAFVIVINGQQQTTSAIGNPDLSCLADGFRLRFEFDPSAAPFHGHIYIKGQFDAISHCHMDMTDANGQQHDEPVSSIDFTMSYRFGDCNVLRERSLNPAGVSYRVTVVVQHHQMFVTHADRAFAIACFYRQMDRYQLSQSLHVSALPTTEIIDTVQMPTCTYELHAGSATLDGPSIRYAKIGDQFTHKWQCQSATHGMLVHSCYVRNGAGAEYRLLDDRGCARDGTLMNDLTYTTNLTMAWVSMAAFKFADQMFVYFQCQITVCKLAENGCEGISPPTCVFLPIEDMRTVAPSSITTPSDTVTEIQPQIDSNSRNGNNNHQNGNNGNGPHFPIEASGYENHFLSRPPPPPPPTTTFRPATSNQLDLSSSLENGAYHMMPAGPSVLVNIRTRSLSAAARMLRNARSSSLSKSNSTSDPDRTLDVAANEMLVFDVEDARSQQQQQRSSSSEPIDNGTCINVWIVLIASIGIGITVTLLMLLQRRHFYRKLSESIVHVYSA